MHINIKTNRGSHHVLGPVIIQFIKYNRKDRKYSSTLSVFPYLKFLDPTYVETLVKILEPESLSIDDFMIYKRDPVDSINCQTVVEMPLSEIKLWSLSQ